MLAQYEDDYPSCERTYCELRIYSGGLSPEDVTRLLDLEATSVSRRGEQVATRAGRTRTTPHNGWFLSSESRVESLDLRRHLDWLMAQLIPRRAMLESLGADPGVDLWVNCVWWSRQGHGGPTLSAPQLRALAELGLECGFDVYFFEPTL